MARSIALCIATATVWLTASAAATSQPTDFAPAALHVGAGSLCDIHPANRQGVITLASDPDGFIRFSAMRKPPRAEDGVLTVDCKDRGGRSLEVKADLRSSEIFAPHPLDVASLPGRDRPALQGNPLRYSQLELLRQGYGFRPDPAKSPLAYDLWLDFAKRPARILGAQPVPEPKTDVPGVISKTEPHWVGATLTGAPKLAKPGTYVMSQASFVIPKAQTAQPQDYNDISLWTGVDGNGNAQSLVQTGVIVKRISGVASDFTFSEYIGGTPVPTTNHLSYRPGAGDRVFAMAWYCNADGTLSATRSSSQYGCTTLSIVPAANGAKAVSVNCLPPMFTQGSECPARSSKMKNPNNGNKPYVYGKSADFVIENLTKQAFLAFDGTFTMHGTAFLSNGEYTTVSTDPQVYRLTDFTNAATHIDVTLGDTDQVNFDVTWPPQNWNGGTPPPDQEKKCPADTVLNPVQGQCMRSLTPEKAPAGGNPSHQN